MKISHVHVHVKYSDSRSDIVGIYIYRYSGELATIDKMIFSLWSYIPLNSANKKKRMLEHAFITDINR